jgi:hypothetical protein
MRLRLLQSILVVTTLSLAGTASAHFQLKAPLPSQANDESGGKGPKPCGPDDASAVITPVTGGSMLELKIDETVYHPGHYRVALALKSRDELDPAKPGGLKEPDVLNAQGQVITSGNSVSAKIQSPVVFPVLADGILAHTAAFSGDQTAMIPIPNVNCDKCTLQVLEFMAQHGPDYFYRHCADLKITADPAKPIFDPSGMGGGGSGGAGGAGGAAGSGGAGGSAAGGAAGSGAASAGTASGGAPGAAGTASGGAPSSAGAAPTTAGSGTGGSAAVTPPASAEDDGGCSVARAGKQRMSLAALAGSLLLGLGWLARRRNRPE